MLKEGLNRQPICRCDQKIPPAQRSKEMLNSVGLEPTRNYPLAVSTGVPEASAITTRPTVRVVDQCNWWKDGKIIEPYPLIKIEKSGIFDLIQIEPSLVRSTPSIPNRKTINRYTRQRWPVRSVNLIDWSISRVETLALKHKHLCSFSSRFSMTLT